MELLYNVGYRIDEDLHHGIRKAYKTAASFSNPQNAEDFIFNCIQEEQQNRFYIENTVKKLRYYPKTMEVEEM